MSFLFQLIQHVDFGLFDLCYNLFVACKLIFCELFLQFCVLVFQPLNLSLLLCREVYGAHEQVMSAVTPVLLF